MRIKKLSKKITAFLFTFVLLISMLPMSSMATAVTTEATINPSLKGSLTIIKKDDLNQPLEGAAYTIYKVADIVQTEDNGEVAISYTPVTELTGNGFSSEINANTSASVFEIYRAHLTGTPSAESGTDGKIEFTTLDLGIYLVVETTTPDGVATPNNFLVSIPMSILDDGGTTTWNYDITAEPKNSVIDTTIEKTIAGGVSTNTTIKEGTSSADGKYSASRGDVISYQIEAVLPSNFNAAGIEYSLFAITDTYPDVLDINTTNGITVALDGVTLESSDYTVTVGNGTGTKSFTVTLKLTSNTWKNAAKGTLTITYDAEFTTGALINTDYQNDVQTDFTFKFEDKEGEKTVSTVDEDADVEVDPVEPEEEEPIVVTYSYTLTKVKYVEKARTILPGAEFVIKVAGPTGNYLIYDDEDRGWISSPDTDINEATVFESAEVTGYVTFPGLAEGEYEIIEVKAPEGFSLLKESIPVSINVNTTGSNGNPISRLDVVNSLENSWVLPATGEFGIYLFTIGGVILIAAAIILLSKNKKKNNA